MDSEFFRLRECLHFADGEGGSLLSSIHVKLNTAQQQCDARRPKAFPELCVWRESNRESKVFSTRKAYEKKLSMIPHGASGSLECGNQPRLFAHQQQRIAILLYDRCLEA